MKLKDILPLVFILSIYNIVYADSFKPDDVKEENNVELVDGVREVNKEFGIVDGDYVDSPEIKKLREDTLRKHEEGLAIDKNYPVDDNVYEVEIGQFQPTDEEMKNMLPKKYRGEYLKIMTMIPESEPYISLTVNLLDDIRKFADNKKDAFLRQKYKERFPKVDLGVTGGKGLGKVSDLSKEAIGYVHGDITITVPKSTK